MWRVWWTIRVPGWFSLACLHRRDYQPYPSITRGSRMVGFLRGMVRYERTPSGVALYLLRERYEITACGERRVKTPSSSTERLHQREVSGDGKGTDDKASSRRGGRGRWGVITNPHPPSTARGIVPSGNDPDGSSTRSSEGGGPVDASHMAPRPDRGGEAPGSG